MIGSNVNDSGGTISSTDFESGQAGYVVNNNILGSGTSAGLWHLTTRRGTQTGHSPTTSFYYGSESTGTYDTGAANAGSITSPVIALPVSSSISLSFNYVLQTESSTSYDTAYVEVSTNGFATYTTVGSRSTNLPNSSTWTTFTANVSSFSGENVQIRFIFDTIDNILNDYEGWYVNDVRLSTPASLKDYYSVNLSAGDVVSVGLKNLSGTGTSLSVLNPSGGLLASGAAGPSNLDQVAGNISIPAAGKYYLLVTGSAAATYDLVITRDAALDSEPNNTLATAQPLPVPAGSSSTGALGYVEPSSGGAGSDYYSVSVSAGNTLTVATKTPGDGSGEFVNNLVPTLQLYNSSGTLVASGTVGADGRNQSLSYFASTGGTYDVRVQGTTAPWGSISSAARCRA